MVDTRTRTVAPLNFDEWHISYLWGTVYSNLGYSTIKIGDF